MTTKRTKTCHVVIDTGNRNLDLIISPQKSYDLHQNMMRMEKKLNYDDKFSYIPLNNFLQGSHNRVTNH